MPSHQIIGSSYDHYRITGNLSNSQTYDEFFKIVYNLSKYYQKVLINTTLPIESSRAYKGADSHPYIIKFLSNPTSETTDEGP